MAELDNGTRVVAHLGDTTVGGRLIRHTDECEALVLLDQQYVRVDTTRLDADQPKAEAA